MNEVKIGSRWWASGNEKRFVVINIVEDGDNTWVHYREDPAKWKAVSECKEYSCYVESFVERFSELAP
jgi:hypothetical protein